MSGKFLGKWFLVFFVLIATSLIAEDKKPGASDPSKEEKKSESVQCSEKTQAGERCKRMTRNANGKCFQHGGNAEEAVETKEEVKKEESKPSNDKKDSGKAEKSKAEEKKEAPAKEEPKKEEVKKEEVKKEGEETASVQCSEKTQAGERCKKMTKSPNGKCKQHGGN